MKTRSGKVDPLDIRRLANGDESEWVRFCKLKTRLMLAAAHRVGLGPTETEDLVQNATLVCYHAVARLRDAKSLDSFVYRIAYRQALELVHKRPPEAEPELPDGGSVFDLIADPRESETDALERHEVAEQLGRALAGMEDRCRNLLEHLYLSGATPGYEEVSAKLGMPVGSIGPTRARCLDRLRSRLKSVSEVGVFTTAWREGEPGTDSPTSGED